MVITSHGDVIRGTLMHILGMPVDYIHRCEVSPASVSEVRWGDDWAQVWSMNVLLD